MFKNTFRQFNASICAVLAACVSLLTTATGLANWQFDNLITPVTAASFLLIAFAVIQLRNGIDKRNRFVVRIVAGLIFLISVLQPVDLIFANDLVNGELPATSSIIMVLCASTLFLLTSRDNIKIIIAHSIAVAVGLVSCLSIVCYLSDARSEQLLNYLTMPVATSASFLLMSTALLLTRSSKGFISEITSAYSGGLMARLILPVVITIAVVVGMINIHGIKTGWYNTSFGLPFQTITTIMIFACVVLYCARKMNKIDEERLGEINRRIETEKKIKGHQQTLMNFGLQLEKTVSERTQELKESRNILEKAQTVGHMGHWVYDIACTGKVMWSDELHRILGTDKNDFDGSPEAFYARIHPGDFDFVSGEIANAAFKRNELEIQFRIVRANGITRWVDLMLEVMRGNHDEPIQLIGVVRDITSSKEAEIERANMLADLVQRNKDLEQFAYIVSHNLRAPAANIVGLADALQKPTLPDALRATFTKDISASAVKLDSIILDLNQILKVRGQVNEAREVIHFSELVQEVNTSIRDMMRMENAWIITDFSDVDEMPAIKSYMQSIFYNLITNSIKYRKPTERPILEIKSRRSGEKRIELTFKDNGIGIDLKKKGDQVFGLYKRFHTGKEGTGLGLFMVKTQVETLGGKISIESTPMVGTEFSIEFDFAHYANAA